MQTAPVEYINFKALRVQVANYEFLLDKLLELFLTQAPLWLQGLDGTVAEQDPTLVRQLCHKIKGGAATLQAGYIVEAATELSRHAAAGDLDAAEQSRIRLIAAINGTVAFVQAAGYGKTKC